MRPMIFQQTIYAVIGGTLGLAAAIISVLLSIGCAWATKKYDAQHFVTVVLGFGAMAAQMIALGILISDRAVLASELFTWNSSNTIGWNAFYTRHSR